MKTKVLIILTLLSQTFFVQAQLYSPEIKVLQTTNNDIVIGGGTHNSILKVENDMYIKRHKKIRFPGGIYSGTTQSLNKIYSDQTGPDSYDDRYNWRFVSQYDNMVFNAGENNGRSMRFQIGGQDAIAIHYSSRNVGIGIQPLLNGDKLMVAGSGISNNWKTYSDERLKKNISNFEGGLAVVKGVHPIRYNYDEKKFAGKDKLHEKEHIGVSAQELQKVAPYLVGKIVTEIGEEYLTVDNSGLDFVLLSAIKEQQTIIDQLKAEIEVLRQAISGLESSKSKFR